MNAQEEHSKFCMMHCLNNFLLISIEIHSHNVTPHFDEEVQEHSQEQLTDNNLLYILRYQTKI